MTPRNAKIIITMGFQGKIAIMMSHYYMYRGQPNMHNQSSGLAAAVMSWCSASFGEISLANTAAMVVVSGNSKPLFSANFRAASAVGTPSTTSLILAIIFCRLSPYITKKNKSSCGGGRTKSLIYLCPCEDPAFYFCLRRQSKLA